MPRPGRLPLAAGLGQKGRVGAPRRPGRRPTRSKQEFQMIVPVPGARG